MFGSDLNLNIPSWKYIVIAPEYVPEQSALFMVHEVIGHELRSELEINSKVVKAYYYVNVE
jgi:hypothetical protein